MDDSPPRRKIGHDSRDLRQAEGGRPQETARKESQLRGRPTAQRTLIIAPQRECGETGPLQDRKLADCGRTKCEKEADSVCQNSPQNRPNRIHRDTEERFIIGRGWCGYGGREAPRSAGGRLVSPGRSLSLSPKSQEPRRLRAGGQGCPSPGTERTHPSSAFLFFSGPQRAR